MSKTRMRHLLVSGAACLLLSAGWLFQPAKRLIFNTTASAPLGFYWLAATEPAVGDLALVRPPQALARWMAIRGYLPLNVPLIKHVAAVGGQAVCGRGGLVRIDGRVVARPLHRDHLGRPLTAYTACRTLRADEVFLLNPDAPHSLDGRYFGPLPRHCVAGRLRPLWTWER
jgi:conjugative transfer signal peptidase TraF